MNVVIIGAIVGFLLGMVEVKKEGFAWQRTLGGLKAIQWLKPGMEFTPVKLEFGLGENLAKQGYAISEWNLEKECVVLHEEATTTMPLLIGSRGLLNFFGEIAKEWEELGSSGSTLNEIDTITIGHAAKFVYKFDRGEGQFDPYFVVADEVRE